MQEEYYEATAEAAAADKKVFQSIKAPSSCSGDRPKVVMSCHQLRNRSEKWPQSCPRPKPTSRSCSSSRSSPSPSSPSSFYHVTYMRDEDPARFFSCNKTKKIGEEKCGGGFHSTAGKTMIHATYAVSIHAARALSSLLFTTPVTAAAVGLQ